MNPQSSEAGYEVQDEPLGSSGITSGDTVRRERLAAAIEEYYLAADANVVLDQQALLTKYADIATDLAACLTQLNLLRQMGQEKAGQTQVDSTGPDGDSCHHMRLGDFQIIRELGRGGMGIVYEAEQLSVHRRVALKILPFASMIEERRLTRFRNESRAAANLDHPHIVSVYSVGCERGIHYYSMRLIDGGNLHQVMQSIRSMRNQAAAAEPDSTEAADADQDRSSAQLAAATSSLASADSRMRYRRIAELGIQAAEALAHAHHRGIIHRDIKPANLLLDASGSLWITDFGLAYIEDASVLTMTGQVLGTLYYMSPEQILGGQAPVDHRTDIYSLGVTLYELVSGHKPLEAADRGGLMRAIAEQEPRWLRAVEPSVPHDLAIIIHKAMEKEPGHRYQTAEQFAADLKRFATGQPIQARRVGIRERTQRWMIRHPWFVVSACAAVLVWLAGANYVVMRTVEQRNTARREQLALAAERDFTNTVLELLNETVQRQASDAPSTPEEISRPVDAEVLSSYRQAISRREQLVAENPSSINYVVDLAATHSNFGALLALRGDLDRAADEMLASLRLMDSRPDLMFFTPSDSERPFVRHAKLRQTATLVLRRAGRTLEAMSFARPLGITLGPDGLLYVCCRGIDAVVRVDPHTGRAVDQMFCPSEWLGPHGTCFASDGSLLVSCEDRVVRFDPGSCSYQGVVARGVQHGVGISTGTANELYVACAGSNEVRQFDLNTGQLQRTIRGSDAISLQGPTGLLLDTAGDLLVACQHSSRIERFDRETGESKGVFAEGGGLTGPVYMTFGPDGDLYVAGNGSHGVYRYDGRTGAFVEKVLDVQFPEGLAFDSQGQLFVTTIDRGTILAVDANRNARFLVE